MRKKSSDITPESPILSLAEAIAPYIYTPRGRHLIMIYANTVHDFEDNFPGFIAQFGGVADAQIDDTYKKLKTREDFDPVLHESFGWFFRLEHTVHSELSARRRAQEREWWSIAIAKKLRLIPCFFHEQTPRCRIVGPKIVLEIPLQTEIANRVAWVLTDQRG